MPHSRFTVDLKKGFTLIEALLVLFIMSLITLTFYETWRLGTWQIANAKYRLGASALANQHMEIIRGLTFDDIGTTTGIPNGVLAQDETVSANTTTYTVHTVVQFVDDPTDGTLLAGTDIAPNDYKKATLTVSWGGETASEEVTLSSLFSLDGVESVAAGTGILSVNTLNSAGVGIGEASVHITNTSVTPAVDIMAETDANGNLMFPGAPASVQKYHITVSKDGYYGNLTYSPYPTSSFKPKNVHASVAAGSLSAATLIMDEYATLAISSQDPFGEALPDIDFTLSGGLVQGNDAVSNALLYDFTQAETTDENGIKSFDQRSAGVYQVVVGGSASTNYEFLHLTPKEATKGFVNISGGATQTVGIVLADKHVSSTLITAERSADGTAIVGASVRLSNTTLGYDTTLTTDIYGEAYFPATTGALAAGTYDVSVSATDFATETGTVVIPGAALVKKTLSLEAS